MSTDRATGVEPHMPLTVLFASPRHWPTWRAPLVQALAEIGPDVGLTDDLSIDPETVDVIICAPNGPLQDFAPYRNCKAVLSLWAGVESIVGNPTLTQPLCRMVDPAMTRCMADYVCGHVLRHHLGIDRYLRGQDGLWRTGNVPPPSSDRRVTVLGLGTLGRACAEALAGLGFRVSGWSRGQRDIPGIECHHGESGLAAALSRADMVVTLVPDTPATRNLLNAERLALLPPDAVIINPGRGSLIDDDALLAALDSGRLGHATLDVFRTEPLPSDHPFWAHPQVTVTPHIAAETRPDTASGVIAENIRRAAKGLPLLHLVDRDLGY